MSIDKWRKNERSILRELCHKHGIELAEEKKGRSKTYTPDMYKNAMDDAREKARQDPNILNQLKAEVRLDMQEELLTEQQYLVDEVSEYKKEVNRLLEKKTKLQNTVKQEQQNFKNMQKQFKPRKDDLDKINKISKEAKPAVLSNKISITKEDWDFIINIAKQHAKISDTTLTALENQENTIDTLKRCQSLYLAVASEVAALDWSDRSKLTQSVKDVLKDVDSRDISWLINEMTGHKPSELDEILEAREANINKKYNFAKKMRDYNQITVTPKKTKKRSYSNDK